jgi:glyoxylase-like metal-dependent hydrolase (beta-lactamase superfamily II)
MPGLEDELGDVVRKARGGLGIELADLAQRVGMIEADLKGVEVYTRHPDEAQVRRLAEALQLRPDQLWDLAQDAWSAPEVPWQIGDDYSVERLTNHYPEHCYVILDRQGACLIVDPGDEAERILETVRRDERKPAGILITHYHQDHTGAVVPVQQGTGSPVYVHQADRQGVDGVPESAIKTFGGDGELTVGPFTLRLLHTPGHTAGSTSYVLTAGGRTAAFCGDTLFAGSVGNARAGYDAILDSVRNKLARLPEDTVLYPGHGPASTVANERARNPFL